MSLVEYNLFGEKRDKVQRAIDIVRSFEPLEGYYLAGLSQNLCKH